MCLIQTPWLQILCWKDCQITMVCSTDMTDNSFGCWSSNKQSITVYHMHTNECLNVNLSTLCLVLDQTLTTQRKCFSNRSGKKHCSYGCSFRSLQLSVISISTLFQKFLLKWCRRNKQIQMRQLLLYSARSTVFILEI